MAIERRCGRCRSQTLIRESETYGRTYKCLSCGYTKGALPFDHRLDSLRRVVTENAIL